MSHTKIFKSLVLSKCIVFNKNPPFESIGKVAWSFTPNLYLSIRTIKALDHRGYPFYKTNEVLEQKVLARKVLNKIVGQL